MLYLHFCIYFDCKDTNKNGNKEELSKKKRLAIKKSKNIWNFCQLILKSQFVMTSLNPLKNQTYQS